MKNYATTKKNTTEKKKTQLKGKKNSMRFTQRVDALIPQIDAETITRA
jgi:hypothetical protein